jgi:CheY-like chemotaxis protein
MAEPLNPTIPQSGTGICILYAEDEEDDVIFLEHALRQASSPCMLKAVPDGQQAIEYLAGDGDFADRSRHPLPALILLDIKLPKKSGLEVLDWIRQQPGFKSSPVVMLTSSTRQEDMDNAHQLGANDYLLKPSNPLKLAELVRTLHDRWLTQSVA